MPTLKVPRKVRSRQVKQKIFDAALSLIQEKGYEYVTVSNVCQTAKVSVGSFYHHFGNKDELLSYYFVAGYERYKNESQPPESDDFIEQILYIFGLYVRFCLDQDIQFIKNFYTPSNASLYITADDVSDKTRLPILAKVYEALEEPEKKPSSRNVSIRGNWQKISASWKKDAFLNMPSLTAVTPYGIEAKRCFVLF